MKGKFTNKMRKRKSMLAREVIDSPFQIVEKTEPGWMKLLWHKPKVLASFRVEDCKP